jgi:1-acyl-sn-glycerol-3-phosphate acyltransferase
MGAHALPALRLPRLREHFCGSVLIPFFYAPMKHFFEKVHLYYCLLLFAISFLLVFPFFLIPIVFKKKFRLVGVINRTWGHILFPILFLPYQVDRRGKIDSQKQYIFCPNHFSYLDIPVMALNPYNAIFVGKDAMERIPLFGFMYRNLHITVNREKLKSRYDTYIKSGEALDQGKSLTIFPEGGIVSKELPRMGRFKDGAFRLAIEKQIPIVPVTIATNWIILPDGLNSLRRQTIRIVLHEPIEPDATRWTVQTLKDEVYRIIDTELRATEAQYKNA